MKEDFKLTDDQQQAFDEIIDWLYNSDEQFKTLKGYAGTGKTTLLNEIVREAKSYKGNKRPSLSVIVTATTNKAVKVLRERVVFDNFSTIHSLLNIKPVKKGKKEIFQPIKFVASGKKNIRYYDLVIIDECSMISSIDGSNDKEKSLLTIIKEETEDSSVKILFCGDEAQLQPINETVSQCFDYNPSVLTKIVRHGDTIANQSKLVRNTIDYVPIDSLIAEPDIVETDVGEIIRNFKSFRMNPDRFRMLCWTNNSVKLWNAKLRIADYGYKPDAPYMKGDILMANEPCEDEGYIIMNNSEEGVVTEVQDVGDSYIVSLEKIEGGYATVRILKEKHKKTVKENLEELAEKTRWPEFWSLKKKYHDVRHCYALTIHKSQGSTFENVIIDRKDVCLNNDDQNRNQLIYVGMTRASNKVYLY